MEFSPLPQNEITPSGEEFPAPGREFTPPAPEFTPVGASVPAQPQKKRAKRYLIAFLALLVMLIFAGQTLPLPPAEPQPSTAPSRPDVPPTEPDSQTSTEPTEEPARRVHLTVYAGYFEAEQEAVLLEENYEDFISAAIPQPEPQAGYVFLGYALVQHDRQDNWISRSVSDTLRLEDVAQCRPDEKGVVQVNLCGVWRGDGSGRAFLPLTLDANGGEGTAQYDASSPKLSGTTVYLAPFPVPARPGWRFTGWYREKEGGEQVVWLPATAFYGEENGETDWRTQLPVTLYAHWEKEP